MMHQTVALGVGQGFGRESDVDIFVGLGSADADQPVLDADKISARFSLFSFLRSHAAARFELDISNYTTTCRQVLSWKCPKSRI